MTSWNDEVVVFAGGPVVAEGHVFVVGEEQLGIYVNEEALDRQDMKEPCHSTVRSTFALISLAGNLAEDAAMVDVGSGVAGTRHHVRVAHGRHCGSGTTVK